MKLCFAASLFLACTAVFAEPVTQPDVFLASVRAAATEKDAAKWEALFYTRGLSEADLTQLRKTIAMQVRYENAPPISLSYAPLPKDFETKQIALGKRAELNCIPTGILRIDYRSSENSVHTSTMPYAIIDGAYWLPAMRMTDLGWRGPNDGNIGFMVLGVGQNTVKIHYKYNASGVDMEREASSSSLVTLGQYFCEITVASDDPNADVQLVVTQAGREIFRSKPLKGTGVLRYVRESETDLKPGK